LSNGEKEDLKYCCLSHCCGGANDISRLTSTTPSELRETIKISGLPRPFQEAILITRQLGIKYLWVDCLCIIQDSEDDWVHESAMMGAVYENSYCTITASGAWNSYQGCFVSRNPFPPQTGQHFSHSARGALCISHQRLQDDFDFRFCVRLSSASTELGISRKSTFPKNSFLQS